MTENCKHDTFIGSPPGCTPTHWRCGCGLTLTAGEMFLWGKLGEMHNIVLSRLPASGIAPQKT